MTASLGHYRDCLLSLYRFLSLSYHDRKSYHVSYCISRRQETQKSSEPVQVNLRLNVEQPPQLVSSVSESYPATQSRHSDLDPGRINVSISALAHGHCYGSRLSDWTGKYLLVCTPGTGTWKPSFCAPCHEDHAAQSLVLSGPFCASRLSTWPPFVMLCALCSCGHKTLSNVWLIRLCKGQPQPLGQTRVRVTLLHTCT